MIPDSLTFVVAPEAVGCDTASAIRRVFIGKFIDEHSHSLLAGVLALALLVRVLALVSITHSLYGDFLLYDERTYDVWARDLLQGNSCFIYSLSPLPAYLVAAIYKLFGPHMLHVRLVNVAFGVLTCGFIYGIATELRGKTVGLLSALVTALYKPFIFFSVTLLKEPLGLLLFSWMLYLFVAELTSNRCWQLPLIAILAGLLVNVRQNAAITLLIIGPVLLWTNYQRHRSRLKTFIDAAIFCASFTAACSPFLLQNYRGTGKMSPMPLGGFDLYLGNNPTSTRPYYSPAPFAATIPDEQGIQFTIEASRQTGRRLTLAEGSGFWSKKAVSWANNHPAQFAHRLLRKSLVVFNGWEESDNHHIDFVAGFIPFFKYPWFGFSIVMPLGVAGLLACARRDLKSTALLGVVALYVITLVTVFSNMRIRSPLIVIFIPYAIVGVLELLKAGPLLTRKRLVTATAASAFVTIELLPVAGIGDLTGHYNLHASLLASKGQRDKAVAYWQMSSNARGYYSAFADISLSYLLLSQGDSGAALNQLAKIGDDSFVAFSKYDALGDVLRAKGELNEATNAYERSLAINSAQRFVYRKLIDIYAVSAPEKAARTRERLGYISSFYGICAAIH